MINAIQNFQIPVLDFIRAINFYNHILGYKMHVMETPEYKIGIFNFDNENGVGGTIIKSDGLEPSIKGTMVYLHTGNDLQPVLDRILEKGGTVVISKSMLGPKMGYFAVFEDLEGNRVGLYSNN